MFSAEDSAAGGARRACPRPRPSPSRPVSPAPLALALALALALVFALRLALRLAVAVALAPRHRLHLHPPHSGRCAPRPRQPENPRPLACHEPVAACSYRRLHHCAHRRERRPRIQGQPQGQHIGHVRPNRQQQLHSAQVQEVPTDLQSQEHHQLPEAPTGLEILRHMRGRHRLQGLRVGKLPSIVSGNDSVPP
jgi:hypothetical protein